MRVFLGRDGIFESEFAVETGFGSCFAQPEAGARKKDGIVFDLVAAVIEYAAAPCIQTKSADVIQFVVTEVVAVKELPLVCRAPVFRLGRNRRAVARTLHIANVS